jgi:uncharacterized protein
MQTPNPLNHPEILISNDPAQQATGQCDCDCDCACAEISSPVGFSADFAHSRWQKAPGLSIFPVSDTHNALFNPSSPVSAAILNQPAQEILEAFQTPHTTAEIAQKFPDLDENELGQTLEKLASLNLIRPENDLTALPLASAQSTVLTAWLHITDRCNLRCSYCYLPHVHEDMSIETGKAAIDATLNAAVGYGYPRVKLKYAGGEALLRYSAVLELHQYARERSSALKLALDGVVLSNGTLLTPEMISGLKSAGLRLMISLDGLSESHDAQRVYASGRGTSQDVLRGIETALQNGLTPDISITISSRNADGLPALISWVLDHQLPFSLNFYRENDLSKTHADLALDDEKIIAGMRAAFKVIEEKLPAQSLLASIMDRANLSAPHSRTCSAGNDYLVYDQSGRLSQCQMLMHKKVGDVHSSDPLALIRNSADSLQNLPVHQKSECSQCQWRYWCTGGCPISTQRTSGRFDLKSPNCHIYQSLYPDVLRLEGLRLLKYHSSQTH